LLVDFTQDQSLVVVTQALDQSVASRILRRCYDSMPTASLWLSERLRVQRLLKADNSASAEKQDGVIT
jgi:hypothetical protein